MKRISAQLGGLQPPDPSASYVYASVIERSQGRKIHYKMGAHAGVISRGLRGAEPPLLKFLLMLGGAQPPLKLLHWLGFSEFIGLASKVL